MKFVRKKSVFLLFFLLIILFAAAEVHAVNKKVVDVVVKKEWVSNDPKMHPDSIQIELLQNGKSMEPTHIKSLNADNNWTESFTELPAEGNEYTVREDFLGVENYNTVIDRSQSGNVITYTIKNTKILTADFPLIWKVIEAPDESSLNTNYTFTISGDPLPKDENGKDVSSVTISSKDDPRQKTVGKVTFSAADGTYTWTVAEEPDPDGKYTVTPKEYTVTFTVKDGAVSGPVIQIDGQDYAGRDLVFMNEYPWPVGTTEAWVRKRIDGFQPIDHHETYTFRIYRLTPGAPMPDAESDRLGYKEVTLTGEGETGFGPIHFTCRSDEDCEYKYSVREIIPLANVSGETFDTTVYNCTLIIDHKTSEVINKIVEVDGKPVEHKDNTYVFVNSFPDTIPTVEPKVRMVVRHGDPDRGDKFFFELELIQKPQGVEKDPMPVLSDGTKKVIDMNGEDILNGITESFGKIQFEAYGEYVYRVRELQKKDLPEEEYYDKYAYDDNVFTVHYDVHPAADGKSIIADVIWYDKSGSVLREDGLVDGAVTFQNPLRLPDDADDIHVRKVIAPEGVEIEHTTPFSFTLELLDAPKDLPVKPLPAEHSGGTLSCEYDVPGGTIYKCTLVSGSRSFYFGEMDFVVDGTYTFVVKEEAGDDPDFDYSTEAYYVIYEVANRAIVKKTILTKDEEPYEDAELIFTNTYHKPLHTEVEAFVKNVILDGAPQAGDIFRFTLEARDPAFPMPEGSSGRTKTIEVRASKDEPMESGFGPISFTKEGVYIYDVTEVKGDPDHYAYDSTIYTLIWTVTSVQNDLRSRQLKAELMVEMDGYREDVRTGETLLFENEYADPDEGTLMIRKLISGGTPPVREYFTFHAEGLETTVEGLEVSPLPEKCRENLCTLNILGTGHGYFGKVKYDRDGEYNYRIWEARGSSEDYEYDGSVYTVKMTVRDGVLLRDQIEIRRDGVLIPNHEAVISFENHYLKGYDEMHPTVENIVPGDPDGDDPFVFRLQVRPDQPGNPMPSGAVDGILEITIDGEGLKNFGTIEFDEPGTYVYTITEVSGNDPAYRYDASVYTVTYEVAATETGTSVVRTVKKDGQDWTGREYVFTNIWEPGEP